MTNVAPAAAQAERLFSLVLDVIDVQVPTPAEIIPNHWLRRPTLPEVGRIRDALITYAGSAMGLSCIARYELPGFTGSGTTSHDRNDWHYWVIGVSTAHGGSWNNGLHDLQMAARLTPAELDCGLLFPRDAGPALIGMTGAPHFRRLDLFPSSPVVLDQAVMNSIKDIDRAIKALPPERQNLVKAITRYYRLGAFGTENGLYVLGVFGVIESLLTHNPQGDYDSLTHQIGTKMPLLNRRFTKPLDTGPSKGCDLEKLWKTLYSYRSAVAHGSPADFAKKLKLLKSAAVATSFLDEAAKKLLVLALSEYDLIMDLQRC